MNISERVFEKIQNDNIQQKPKWRFVLHRYTLPAFFGASLTIGSLGCAALLHLLSEADWGSLPGESRMNMVIENIPWVWLCFLVAFLAVAYINYRFSETGYKHRGFFVIIVSLSLNFVIGGTLYYFGCGELLEKEMSRRFDGYNRVVIHKEDRLVRPEKGLVSGRVIRNEGPKIIFLDLKGNEWQVFTSGTVWGSDSSTVVNTQVKVMGEQLKNNNTGQHVFSAVTIIPMTEKTKK